MRLLLLAGFLTAAAAAWAGPDLHLDVDKLARDVAFDVLPFEATACERREPDLCVGAPGARKLLRFSVLAVNQGDADLVVGNPLQEPGVLLPDGMPKWIFSQCHNHFHFQTFARYELRRTGTATVLLQGQKRSFCIEDTRPVTATSARKYCCSTDPSACPGGIQGVQVGWGDDYPSNLPCQWIDITDLAEIGTFDLCVFLNTEGFLPEDPAGNDGCVPVTIDPPTIALPKVKVASPRGGEKLKAGRKVRVRWRQKVRGEFRFREVWLSVDGGATWTLQNITTRPKPTKVNLDAPPPTDDARVRVVVWARDPHTTTGAGRFVRGAADSKSFRILP